MYYPLWSLGVDGLYGLGDGVIGGCWHVESYGLELVVVVGVGFPS